MFLNPLEISPSPGINELLKIDRALAMDSKISWIIFFLFYSLFFELCIFLFIIVIIIVIIIIIIIIITIIIIIIIIILYLYSAISIAIHWCFTT